MKKILSLIAIAGLTLALNASVLAQAAGPKGGAGQTKGQVGQGGQRRMGGGMAMGRGREEMMKKLNLTAAQRTKIEALQKKFQADTKGLQEQAKKAGQDRAARQKVMEAYRPKAEKFQKDFLAILTPAQRKTYDQMIKDQRAQFEKMRKERGGATGAKAGGAKTGGTAKKGGGTAKKGGN